MVKCLGTGYSLWSNAWGPGIFFGEMPGGVLGDGHCMDSVTEGAWGQEPPKN